MKGKVGGQWNKIFMEFYRSILHGFLHFSPVSLSELCSFWFERSLHSAQVRGQICRKDEDPHGRLGAVRGGYGRLQAVQGRMD